MRFPTTGPLQVLLCPAALVGRCRGQAVVVLAQRVAVTVVGKQERRDGELFPQYNGGALGLRKQGGPCKSKSHLL